MSRHYVRFLSYLIAILGLSGCSASWPSVCPVVDKARKCSCAVATFKISDHATQQSPPAGKITLDCDGTPIPVSVSTSKVEK